MKTPIKISLGVIILAVCIVLAALWTALDRLPKKHARSCLKSITELTDQTITTSIPQGNYIKAIEAAEYIQAYYPVGTVLPTDHGFAEQYTIERTKQIERILEVLRAKSGMDYGTNWDKWKTIFNSNTQIGIPLNEPHSE